MMVSRWGAGLDDSVSDCWAGLLLPCSRSALLLLMTQTDLHARIVMPKVCYVVYIV